MPLSEQLVAKLSAYSLDLIGAVLILVIGRAVASVLYKVVTRGLRAAHADPLIVGFAANLAFWAVLVFAVLSALAKFGLQTTSFVAVLGAAGFAIGLALQGSLSNFAAGIMLIAFRPFRIGDRIEAAGVNGIVTAIEIFSTIIRTDQNVKVIIPNAKLYGDVIKNYSSYSGDGAS